MASLEFPLSFDRQYAGPLDDYYVFSSTANRTSFLSNAKRYEGLISYDAQLKKVYVLKNNSGTWAWEELAQGSSAVTTLSGLSDVTIGGGGNPASVGQFLKLSQISPTLIWINSTIQTSDVNNLDTTLSTIGTGLTNLTNEKLDIESPAALSISGGTISFSNSDSIYGSPGSAITSTSITIDSSGGHPGVTHILIHQAASLTLSAAGGTTLTKLTGSGNYKANVLNYIYFTFVGGSTVIYSINQGV